MQRPVGYTPRRGSRLTGYERVLVRAGLGPVAGLDEAGRGACAGPLVVAAVALDRLGRGRLAGAADVEIADSKALTARAREAAYRRIVRSALAWSVVVIEPGDSIEPPVVSVKFETVTEFGVLLMRPIELFPSFVNQSAPSGPTVIAVGFEMFTPVKELTARVVVSIRPIESPS